MINEDEKLSLTEHLDELRKRLIRCAIAILIGFAICYFFKEQLFKILTLPLVHAMKHGESLIFTGIAEAFLTYLQISLFAGIVLAAPYIFYQFWMFIAPGLYRKERLFLLPVVILSTLFFIGGALFAYFLVFPFGFKFLLGFANNTIRALPSMSAYLSFATKLLLAFGVIFELPIVITLLARMGIVSVDGLKRFRKYVVLIAFVAGALLTPPEVLTQTMLALPLILLYEVSIISSRIFGKKSAKEKKDKKAKKKKTDRSE